MPVIDSNFMIEKCNSYACAMAVAYYSFHNNLPSKIISRFNNMLLFFSKRNISPFLFLECDMVYSSNFAIKKIVRNHYYLSNINITYNHFVSCPNQHLKLNDKHIKLCHKAIHYIYSQLLPFRSNIKVIDKPLIAINGNICSSFVLADYIRKHIELSGNYGIILSNYIYAKLLGQYYEELIINAKLINKYLLHTFSDYCIVVGNCKAVPDIQITVINGNHFIVRTNGMHYKLNTLSDVYKSIMHLLF